MKREAGKMQKVVKKKILIVIAVIGILCFGGVTGIVLYAFHLQYNTIGVSRVINISVDESEMTKIGELDGYDIYTKNLSKPYVTDFFANQISLEQALEEEKIRLEDLYKPAYSSDEITVDGVTGTAYYFENYQVIFLEKQCIISPIESN